MTQVSKSEKTSKSIKLGAPTGVRIAGVEMLNKRLVIALTYIHGIGSTTAKNICQALGMSESIRIPDLNDEQLASIRDYITKNFTVEGERRKEVVDAIKSLILKGTYRGTRHKKGLPCRGQNTKTNAKTRKKRGKKS
ncbi:MAG: 30S ribosomal protein S13 [Proteobacteria bacterium]|jgi:small subunit ribosomal protein S13|nr:30S ribosomal protein S13 [Pseudomonadota bacterium]